MPADHQVEAAARIWQPLGVALIEACRETLRRRLLARPRDHRGSEVEAGHAVAARRQFQREEPGAASDIERVERKAGRDHEIEDAVPGGAFGGAADAMAEILVEMCGAAVPMGGDLLFDGIGGEGAHFSPTTSASASTCSV